MEDAVRKLVFAFVVSLVLAALPASAGVLVICNSSVPSSAISKATVEQIFTGGARAFGDGTPIVVAVLKDGAAHDEFLKEFVGKSSAQFTIAWRNLVFSGGASKLPAAFGSEAELVAYVAKTRGAVGYISDGTPHDGVKVLKVN